MVTARAVVGVGKSLKIGVPPFSFVVSTFERHVLWLRTRINFVLHSRLHNYYPSLKTPYNETTLRIMANILD